MPPWEENLSKNDCRRERTKKEVFLSDAEPANVISLDIKRESWLVTVSRPITQLSVADLAET